MPVRDILDSAQQSHQKPATTARPDKAVKQAASAQGVRACTLQLRGTNEGANQSVIVLLCDHCLKASHFTKLLIPLWSAKKPQFAVIPLSPTTNRQDVMVDRFMIRETTKPSLRHPRTGSYYRPI